MAEETRARSQRLISFLAVRELSSLAMLAVVVLIFFVLSGDFLSRENIGVILETVPELGIVAAGITVLMICGEFDLSVGSVFALAPIGTAMLMNLGFPAGIAFLRSCFSAAGSGC